VTVIGAIELRDPTCEPRSTKRRRGYRPDGRYVAYQSDETGQNEVSVRSFSEGGTTSPVSTEGGIEPVWAPTDDIFFYRKGDKVMMVDVHLGSTFSAGRPRVLFEEPDYAFAYFGLFTDLSTHRSAFQRSSSTR
jgi:hypothetical protein